MVMAETVLMLTSIGASEGIEGEQFDFAMAFTQAPCEEPDQFIEHPGIPESLLAEHPTLGPSRGPTHVGKLRKEFYGRHYAARGFSLAVRERLEEMGTISGITIRIFTCDRCAFFMS